MTLTEAQVRARREVESPRGVVAAFGILLVLALVNVLRTRPVNEIVSASLPVSVSLGVAVLVIVAAALLTQRDQLTFASVPTRVVSILIVAVGTMGGVALAGVALYAMGVSAHDAFTWLSADLASDASRTRFAAAVTLPVLVAGLLFLFRLKFRAIYGLSEAAVGLWVGAQQISGATPTEPFVIPILTASVYLMVRGFDNVHQGLTKEPVDRIGVATLEWALKPWRP